MAANLEALTAFAARVKENKDWLYLQPTDRQFLAEQLPLLLSELAEARKATNPEIPK